MTRDSQRSKVYDAENLVHRIFDRSADFPVVEVTGSRLTLPVERHFATAESVQTYLDAVQGLPSVRSTWPRAAVPVAVRERAGQQQADYIRADGVIAVPTRRRPPGAVTGTVTPGDAGSPAPAPAVWALRELVILHELAHHLADDESEEPHGGAFVRRLIELTGVVIGPEAGFLLRTTMWDSGVRID